MSRAAELEAEVATLRARLAAAMVAVDSLGERAGRDMTPDRVSNYLLAHGWKPGREHNALRPFTVEGVIGSAYVPLDTSSFVYAANVRHVVNLVARHEGRPPLDVYLDMLGAT